MNLALARLYLVAPARLGAPPGARPGAGRLLADLIPELVDAGVDVVQLREKAMEARQILELGAPLLEACRAADVPLIINDRPDIALALGADGVHLGTDDLPVDMARRVIGTGIVGCSTHSDADIDAALALGEPVDYIAVGPVFETPTKPGRAAVGPALVEHAARRVELPWFAIGGIEAGNLEAVLAAGARRVVVVRAITEATDPPAAAAELKKMLDAAPLPPQEGGF